MSVDVEAVVLGAAAAIKMLNVCLLSDDVKLSCLVVAGLLIKKASQNLDRLEWWLYKGPTKNREWDFNPNPRDSSWCSRETVF